MFKRLDVHLTSNPVCSKSVEILDKQDFYYYDKDGFELNQAEQKFYRAMEYPLNDTILNHCCWQEPWFELQPNITDLILDHSIFLCRCSYKGDALEQLLKLKKEIPASDYLIRTQAKWGYDFALDAVRRDQVFEVIHIEYDHKNYELFRNHMLEFDYRIRHTDWNDAADQIWAMRHKWEGLTGFEQNHWKANYLLGWSRAEYTEKAI